MFVNRRKILLRAQTTNSCIFLSYKNATALVVVSVLYYLARKKSFFDKIKNKYSSDFDYLPCYILKKILPYVVYHELINFSFERYVFPVVLKVLFVPPIHKTGRQDTVANNQPVLVCFSFPKDLSTQCSRDY